MFSRTVSLHSLVMAAACAALLPVSAQAQVVDGYKFLKAVDEADGNTVNDMVNAPGSTVINTREASTGRTALHIVTERRDLKWMSFLLSRDAKANAEDNKGNTPLLIATQLRFADGVSLLLDKGADVNKGDSRGETPLMKAVLNRDLVMVRLLVSRGANPDKTDSVSGASARDLAKRDPRAGMILSALAAPKVDKNKPIVGPIFK